MALFAKKNDGAARYPGDRYRPVIRCSICTGEQVAGFQDRHTGRVEDVMLLQSPRDLERFRKTYGVTSEIEKIY